MEFSQILSWIIVAVGLIGFYFVGKREWWAWYINLGCQILWWTYALVTGQPAFLVSAAIYSGIFAWNAFKWTRDHLSVKRLAKRALELKAQGIRNEYEPISFKNTQDKIDALPYDTNLDTLDQSGPIHIQSEGMIIHNTKLDGSPTHSPLDIELIARVCHEANRVLQMADGEEDLSYNWHLASDEQKNSSIEGVKTALEGASAIALHDAWCQRKLADGWVYGETKDEGMKTHPCLVPYLRLPESQRIKDHMFRAIVKAFKVDAQEKASAYIPQ